MQPHQSILIHICPLNLLGIAACQDHGASQHVQVLLTEQKRYVTGRSSKATNNNRLRGEWVCKQMEVDVSTEGVSPTRTIRNSEQGSAVSGALDKPTWVLILIAQMERISK